MKQAQDEEALWRVPGTRERHTLLSVLESIEKKILSGEDDEDFVVAVGTDSQVISDKFCFVSVISVYQKGKGGMYYFKQDISRPAVHMVTNQKMRMFEEVTKSIQLAVKMQELKGITPQVHIDASPETNTKSFTSKFSEQLRGYVVSSGFECMLKPDSYAANTIADKHTKKKSNGLR